MNKKIVIIGGNGQVGWDLQRSMATSGNVIIANRQSAAYPIDLAKPDSITATLSTIKPDIIINAAAYTAVDKAESEVELARKINAIAPALLAEQANNLNALLVHYSTDYVFNGESSIPYTEESKTEPINVYGQTKLEGDQAIQHIANNYLIFRTSWVYTNRANNFLVTILNLAKQKKELNIIDDQTGSPTWSRLIADVTARAIYAKCNFDKESGNGLYNLSSLGETSWYGFAKEIIKYAGLEKDIVINPIPTSDYPTPATRPKYVVLSNKKLDTTFSLALPDWNEALKLCMVGSKDNVK